MRRRDARPTDSHSRTGRGLRTKNKVRPTGRTTERDTVWLDYTRCATRTDTTITRPPPPVALAVARPNRQYIDSIRWRLYAIQSGIFVQLTIIASGNHCQRIASSKALIQTRRPKRHFIVGDRLPRAKTNTGKVILLSALLQVPYNAVQDTEIFQVIASACIIVRNTNMINVTEWA